jgi:hypothetical protein
VAEKSTKLSIDNYEQNICRRRSLLTAMSYSSNCGVVDEIDVMSLLSTVQKAPKLVVIPTNSALFSALRVEPRTGGTNDRIKLTESRYTREDSFHLFEQLWVWKGSQGDYWSSTKVGPKSK